MIEIEKKFLVLSDDFKNETIRKQRIVQGYLSSNPERTVRVRIKGENGFLTIKGKSNESGMSRFEWEKEIPLEEAELLMSLCEKGIIDKERHEVFFGSHLYEIDVFFGDNEGLILAEIELNSEDESFERPKWLGEEVTQNPKYYNSFLSKKPFQSWCID